MNLQDALTTIKIHALAVELGYQCHLIGTALLRKRLPPLAMPGARIVYGQFDTSTTGLAAFYRHCDMNLPEPCGPLDLDALIDLPAIIASLPGETLFHQVMKPGATHQSAYYRPNGHKSLHRFQTLNRHGFGTASFFEEDGLHHVEALPA